MSTSPETLFKDNLREMIQRHLNWRHTMPPTVIASLLETEARRLRQEAAQEAASRRASSSSAQVRRPI